MAAEDHGGGGGGEVAQAQGAREEQPQISADSEAESSQCLSPADDSENSESEQDTLRIRPVSRARPCDEAQTTAAVLEMRLLEVTNLWFFSSSFNRFHLQARANDIRQQMAAGTTHWILCCTVVVIIFRYFCRGEFPDGQNIQGIVSSANSKGNAKESATSI